MEVILASASPRRKELLGKIFPEFKIVPSKAEDNANVSLPPKEKVAFLAEIKAKDIHQKYQSSLVIGSDTIVALGNEILEKPKSKQDAIKMLENLSGNSHSVFTAVCVFYNDKKLSFVEETKVVFEKMTEKEIEDYASSDEPYDKAGGYGIQGQASKFISSIEGDYFNVCGLPVSRLYYELKEFLGEKFSF